MLDNLLGDGEEYNCPVHYRLSNNISGLYPLDASSCPLTWLERYKRSPDLLTPM